MLTSPVSQRAGLESDCRILSYNADGSLQGICSGSLRSNREVVTAAHCVNENIKHPVRVQIECGANAPTVPAPRPEYSVTSTGGKVLLNGQTFREKLEGASVRIAAQYSDDAIDGNDFAIIELKKPSKLKPLPLATVEDMNRFFMKQYMEPGISTCNVRPGIECQMSGFGVSHAGTGGSYNAGAVVCDMEVDSALMRNLLLMQNLTKAEAVTQINCTMKGSKTKISEFIRHSLEAVSAIMPESVMQPGDSGGALYCREMNGGAWKQVAVNSMIAMRDMENRHDGSFAIFMAEVWSPVDPARLIPLKDWQDLSVPKH